MAHACALSIVIYRLNKIPKVEYEILIYWFSSVLPNSHSATAWPSKPCIVSPYLHTSQHPQYNSDDINHSKLLKYVEKGLTAIRHLIMGHLYYVLLTFDYELKYTFPWLQRYRWIVEIFTFKKLLHHFLRGKINYDVNRCRHFNASYTVHPGVSLYLSILLFFCVTCVFYRYCSHGSS